MRGPEGPSAPSVTNPGVTACSTGTWQRAYPELLGVQGLLITPLILVVIHQRAVRSIFEGSLKIKPQKKSSPVQELFVMFVHVQPQTERRLNQFPGGSPQAAFHFLPSAEKITKHRPSGTLLFSPCRTLRALILLLPATPLRCTREQNSIRLSQKSPEQPWVLASELLTSVQQNPPRGVPVASSCWTLSL